MLNKTARFYVLIALQTDETVMLDLDADALQSDRFMSLPASPKNEMKRLFQFCAAGGSRQRQTSD
ncbi:hypothetical protein NQZ68_007417 [Dissostichus eleginoides]|nr:hypothetical protein NQZ68_007417 [Dissostichus eleginoides]